MHEDTSIKLTWTLHACGNKTWILTMMKIAFVYKWWPCHTSFSELTNDGSELFLSSVSPFVGQLNTINHSIKFTLCSMYPPFTSCPLPPNRASTLFTLHQTQFTPGNLYVTSMMYGKLFTSFAELQPVKRGCVTLSGPTPRIPQWGSNIVVDNWQMTLPKALF